MPSLPLIILTNDDGIGSPGLAAAAAALDGLGELLIVAPLKQQTGMSRSRSNTLLADSKIYTRQVSFGDKHWPGFAVDATPAMAVECAIYKLAERPASLAVSGINYGENVGSCVTVSGTIGAAIEAADHGIFSMAISLEIMDTDYHSYNQQIDFNTARHFTRQFAAKALNANMPPDVDILKIEVPAAAGTDAGWVVTRQDKLAYYQPHIPNGGDDRQDFQVDYFPQKGKFSRPGTDTHALSQGLVSITPISTDLTSRVELSQIQQELE